MDDKPRKPIPGRLRFRHPAPAESLHDGGVTPPASDTPDLDLLERWLQRDTLDDLCALVLEDLRERCGLTRLLIVVRSDHHQQHWATAPRDESLLREIDNVFATPVERVSLVVRGQRDTGQEPCTEGAESDTRLLRLGFDSATYVSTDRSVEYCVYWGDDGANRCADGDGDGRGLNERPEWRVLVAVLRNMARMEHLRSLSHIDSVTGILNRHYFNKRIIEEVARARRYQRPLALAVFDIDHFKSLNDTYGHQQGDVILRKMAEYVRWTIRSIDVFCRLGGDEFAVLMPDAALEDCAHFADRLLSVLSGQRFALDATSDQIALAVSIGAAVFPDHADKHERLLWCADMALLEAKQRGRARFLLFEESYGHHVSN